MQPRNWPPKGGTLAIPAVRLWLLDTGILHRENVWIWNTNFNISLRANPELRFPKTLFIRHFKSLNGLRVLLLGIVLLSIEI